MHDIGKNIVVALLRAAGYEVIDLGRDVPVDEVIAAVIANKPIMLTGTALMTTTMYAFKEVNDKLLEKGMKDSIRMWWRCREPGLRIPV